jgi:hypothetical protein
MCPHASQRVHSIGIRKDSPTTRARSLPHLPQTNWAVANCLALIEVNQRTLTPLAGKSGAERQALKSS